jgi:hypothetical protein
MVIRYWRAKMRQVMQHRVASILGKGQSCFRAPFANNSQAAVDPIDIPKT